MVVALDAASGAELWRYQSPGDSTDTAGAPTVTTTSVVVGDVYGRSFFALDRFSGQPRWRYWTPRQFPGVHHAPVVRNGVVLAASQGGVHAVDETTGQVVWNRTDLLSGSDLVTCGKVLLVQALHIEALDPSTGRSLGSVLEPTGAEVITSAIAASGARAFVAGYEGAYGLTCS